MIRWCRISRVFAVETFSKLSLKPSCVNSWAEKEKSAKFDDRCRCYCIDAEMMIEWLLSDERGNVFIHVGLLVQNSRIYFI